MNCNNRRSSDPVHDMIVLVDALTPMIYRYENDDMEEDEKELLIAVVQSMWPMVPTIVAKKLGLI